MKYVIIITLRDRCVKRRRKTFWICQTRYEEGQSWLKKEREDLLLNLDCEDLRCKKSTLMNMAICGSESLSSEDLQLYTDTGKKERVSFVFKKQVVIVASAYSALEADCDWVFLFPVCCFVLLRGEMSWYTLNVIYLNKSHLFKKNKKIQIIPVGNILFLTVLKRFCMLFSRKDMAFSGGFRTPNVRSWPDCAAKPVLAWRMTTMERVPTIFFAWYKYVDTCRGGKIWINWNHSKSMWYY